MRLARLVVGDDGSQGAEAAGAWADALAEAAGSQVVRILAAATSAAGEPRHAQGAELPVSATATLLDAADAHDADLIVVGRRGAGGFGTLRLGSVAHQLAEHTARPLAVVPGPTQRSTGGWPFATIVVGHDGSVGGAGATAWAGELAVRSGAKVVVVHAAELAPAYAAPGLDEVYRRSLAEAAGQLVEWTAPLRHLGVDHTTVLEDTGPASALLEASHRHRAELVVVGRRAPGAFPGMEMGSVAHRALGLAPCPVVVVPEVRGGHPSR